jgi:hypothetical protein
MKKTFLLLIHFSPLPPAWCSPRKVGGGSRSRIRTVAAN